MKVILILLMLTGSAFAQQTWPIIYYDPSIGNDANPGTKNNPVKTLEKAKQLLVGAGQIISPLGITTYVGNSRYAPKPLQGN